MLAPVFGATDLPRHRGRRSGVAWRVCGTLAPIGSTAGPESD